MKEIGPAVTEISRAQDSKSENTNFREKFANFAKIKNFILRCTTSGYKEAMYKICSNSARWLLRF